MLSKASLLLLAQALPAILAAPYDGNTWGAYFWTGEQCTSAESGAYTGPNKPHKGTYCAAIPDIGGTQSVDFYANDDRYTFGLHQRDDCSDDGGIFQANPDVPSCIETNNVGGAIAWSVKTGSKSRRGLTSSDSEPVNATDFELERRAQIDSFIFMGIIGAGGFTITATQTCPQAVYPEKQPNGANKGKKISNVVTCGVSAVFAVASAFIAGFHKTGETEAKDQSKRALELGAAPQTFVSDGLNTTITSLNPVTDFLGDTWDQKLLTMTDETGQVYTANYQYHPGTDRHIISADASDDSHDLSKRQSANTYRAYYSWKDETKSIFKNRDTSAHARRQLAADLWNHARQNDEAVFCANFAVRGRQANLAQFALTNGVFAPDFNQC